MIKSAKLPDWVAEDKLLQSRLKKLHILWCDVLTAKPFKETYYELQGN